MENRPVVNDEKVNLEEILEKYDRESVVRTFLNNKLAFFITTLAVLYSLFHLYNTYYPLPELQQRAIHVGFGLALSFLIYPATRKSNRNKISIIDWIFFLLSLAIGGYIVIEYNAIVTTRGGIPNTLDIVFAIIAILLLLEAARRMTGLILPILALVFLTYPFISHMSFMPDKLLTRKYDLGDIFGQLYLKTEGIFSTAIGASVTFIFLFILFGAFLSKSGMGQLFNDLALALAGHKKGGPAKVAVIASGFMGSINGAAVANVVGTGAFTIPMMKKIGYKKNFAGAVEASASVGGQILPPIMGASAFIMSETTGVSYGTIALAAFLPAILYYIGVLAQVHFRAGKDDLKGVPKDRLPQVMQVLKERGHLLLPIFALVYFLYKDIPIGYAALYTIGITILISMLRKETRMSVRDIINALAEGARSSLSVMVACAVVGIVIGVVSLTSFGMVLTTSITDLGQGSLFLTLVMTMVASMILGMGLPSIPCYIITATMAAPALASFGVPILVAHFFVFYFGIFANITPPVALAAFAAAGLSGGDPMKTGFQALKLSLAGFIIPFMFVYHPTMLMIDPTGLPITAKEYPLPPILDIVLVAITAIIGVISLGAAVEGMFIKRLNWILRIVLATGAFLLILPGTKTDIIGFGTVALIFGYQMLNRIKDKSAAKEQISH